jgi:hypothetical protein
MKHMERTQKDVSCIVTQSLYALVLKIAISDKYLLSDRGYRVNRRDTFQASEGKTGSTMDHREKGREF